MKLTTSLVQKSHLAIASALIVFAVFLFLIIQAQAASQNGLQATYFNNKDLTDQKLSRVDSQINFNWWWGSPTSSIGNDTFSVRWTGFIKAEKSELYTFHFSSDDGARLWVNNKLIIDRWFDHPPREYRGSIQLEAGKVYPIKLEYYDNRGRAVAELRWSSVSTSKQLVPQNNLFTELPATTGTESNASSTGSPIGTNTQTVLMNGFKQYSFGSYELAIYRPRQFKSGLVIQDNTHGAQTVSNPGSFAGWDVFAPSNYSVDRINDDTQWVTMYMTRPATVAVVWRGTTYPESGLPTWLNGWQQSGTVSINNQSYPVYKKQVPAGNLTIGGVYAPNTKPCDNCTRDVYWVLFAEQNGQPTVAPSVPAGKTTPIANETCPAWVHDQYQTQGPDGKMYPTWHAEIDPVYWCYFRHEHGSNPALSGINYKPLYNYAPMKHGMDEPNAGFKTYVFDDNRGNMWIVTQHFGTGSLARACVQHHSTDVAVVNKATKELLADTRVLGDYGPAIANQSQDETEYLVRSECPNQGPEAAASHTTGVRKIPQIDNFAGYEPWRVDGSDIVFGLRLNAFTPNTPDGIVICNNKTCDQEYNNAAITMGTNRFFGFNDGFGVVAQSGKEGTFYTNPLGTEMRSATAADAVKQYIKPGLNLTFPEGRHYFADKDWHGLYIWDNDGDPNGKHGSHSNYEGSLRLPN